MEKEDTEILMTEEPKIEVAIKNLISIILTSNVTALPSGDEDQVAKIIFEADASLGQVTEFALPEASQTCIGLKSSEASGNANTQQFTNTKITITKIQILKS